MNDLGIIAFHFYTAWGIPPDIFKDMLSERTPEELARLRSGMRREHPHLFHV